MTLLPQVERELLDAARRIREAPVIDPGRDREHARPKRRRQQRAVLAGLAGVGAATIAALVLLGVTGGSADRGISVAAAADRATSPGLGIIHVVTETTQADPSGRPRGTPTRLESWSTINPDAEHSIQITGSHVSEEATTGHEQNIWTNGRPAVIRTTAIPVIAGHPADPASTLHAMYRSGRVSVVGHENLNGRPVLRLRIAGARPPEAGVHPPDTTVIVDAKTFAPIESIGYASAQERLNGPYIVVSMIVTRFLAFEHLPATTANRALLRITDHPHAKIVHEAS